MPHTAPSWCSRAGRRAAPRGVIHEAGQHHGREETRHGADTGGGGATSSLTRQLWLRPVFRLEGSPSPPTYPPTKQNRPHGGPWTPAPAALTVVNGMA